MAKKKTTAVVRESQATKQELIKILQRRFENGQSGRYVTPIIDAKIFAMQKRITAAKEKVLSAAVAKIFKALSRFSALSVNESRVRLVTGFNGDPVLFGVAKPDSLKKIEKEHKVLDRQRREMYSVFQRRFEALRDRIVIEGPTDELTALVLDFKVEEDLAG